MYIRQRHSPIIFWVPGPNFRVRVEILGTVPYLTIFPKGMCGGHLGGLQPGPLYPRVRAGGEPVHDGDHGAGPQPAQARVRRQELKDVHRQATVKADLCQELAELCRYLPRYLLR